MHTVKIIPSSWSRARPSSNSCSLRCWYWGSPSFLPLPLCFIYDTPRSGSLYSGPCNSFGTDTLSAHTQTANPYLYSLSVGCKLVSRILYNVSILLCNILVMYPSYGFNKEEDFGQICPLYAQLPTFLVTSISITVYIHCYISVLEVVSTSGWVGLPSWICKTMFTSGVSQFHFCVE